MNLKTATDVLTAAGTFAAVIVALFGRDIRRTWRKPKLVAIARTSRQDHSIERTANDQGYYLRLWIENQGQEPVEKAQVFLDPVSKRQADGTYRQVDGFLPMNLRWAHETSGRPEAFADVISPGVGRLCNIGGVMKSRPTEFVLWTEIGPSSRSNVLSGD